MEPKREEITSIEFEFNNEERISFYELDISHHYNYQIMIEDIKSNQIIAGGMLSAHLLVNAIFISIDETLNTEKYYNENDEEGRSKYQLSKFERISKINDITSITINTKNNSYLYVVPWIGEPTPDSQNPCQQSFITDDGVLYLAIAYDENKCTWWVDDVRLQETAYREKAKA